MSADRPANVREISALHPRLRDDLHFVFQEFSGERCCVLEDPVTSRYHRIGLAEHALMRRLDGKTPFAEACARAALESGSEALSERSSLALLAWLVEHRLADLGGNVPIDVLDENRSRKLSASVSSFFNLLSIRIPLGSPDRFLKKCKPLASFFCSHFFFVLWMITVVGGLLQIFVHREEWKQDAVGILAPANWLWLMAVWAILKVWHEFWHGLVCIHHGGRVREAGMLLIVLMPLGYVDASSSLAFPSRWKRIQVAGAGMYGELFLAGIAAGVWTLSGDALVRHLAINTVMMAGATTILFNMNPLMRFDGYYILSDLMGVPNLSTRSSAWLRYVASRIFLGRKSDSTPETGGKSPLLYVSYGLLALLWRILVMATLLLGATLLFRGGGLVIAVLSILVTLINFIHRTVKKWNDGGGDDFPWPTFLFRTGLALLLFGMVLFVPFKARVTSPAVAQYAGEEIHRVDLPGRVAEFYVRDGEAVVAGQKLLRLENLEAQNRLQALRLEVNHQEIRYRKKFLSGKPAEAEAEAATLKGLREQYHELQKRVDSLEVRALSDGIVLAPDLQRMEDMYLSNGNEIIRLAQPSRIEWILPVPVTDAEDFRMQLGREVWILPEGRFRAIPGVFSRMAGRAVTTPDYQALTVLAGGELSLRANSKPSRDHPHELIQPVFWGVVEYAGDEALSLRAGERAHVRFNSTYSLSIWRRTIRAYEKFLDIVFARIGKES
ncbi:hypothetical protein P3T73_10630 [Kiritimatiellota bacterium B12222]|nr:hypothetical protein P3T73_10630 [Kiritimatiellota bacterium B12222]